MARINQNKNQNHYRNCNLCEAMCGLEIIHNDREIISIRGDKKDVLSKGHICPKAVGLKDLYHDKDRLKTPIKRTETGWEEISWNDAFDEVAERIKKIQQKYGTNSVSTYQGNPNVHNWGMMLYGTPFIKSLKTKQKFTATSVDQLPHHIASLLMFGHQMLIPIPDIDRTDFLLILGANPVVSNGSMLTAPGFAEKIKSINKRDGKVINIDPRFTETSKIASEHHHINPGKDALLLFSLIHTILKKNLNKESHLPIKDLDTIKEIAKDFSPQKTSASIGISMDAIENIAISFAKADKAVCYGRIGVSTQEFGGLCQWLVNILNVITNNTDRVGGAMFTKPAVDLVMMTGMQGKTGTFNRYQSRVNNLPEYSGEFPVATLSDEILTEGEDQIKAFVCIAGNPVLSTPNGKRLEKALSQLEFMVSIDIYLNETSKHADIILPSTTGLETSHYDLAFHQLAIRNTAKYNPILFEKGENQKHDWQILSALTERITGVKNPATPEMMLDMMLKLSSYQNENLSVEKLKQYPHGIDFGALKPCLEQRLFTKDKRINLAPECFVRDVARLRNSLEKETKSEFPFYLIGRRQLRNNNSWMHNSEILIKGKNRCTVLMNTKDAERLNLKDKQDIRVTSNVSSVKIPVEISSEMMEGVVSIPHGFGHHRDNLRMQLAQENAGVSINDLTDDKNFDALTGNANFSGTRVRIEA